VTYANFNTPEDRSSAHTLLLELADYDNYVYTINGEDIDKQNECNSIYMYNTYNTEGTDSMVKSKRRS
jgi:hypothetical protein